jgi:hypothetical protein
MDGRSVTVKQAGLPPDISALPLPQQIGWLDSVAACALLSRAARKRLRRAMRARVCSGNLDGPTAAEREAAHNRIGLWTCSDPWEGVCYEFLEAQGLVGGVKGVHPTHARKTLAECDVYPPRAEPGWGMLRCNVCGRDVPRHCVGSSGGCDECRYEAAPLSRMAHWDSSRSIMSWREQERERGGK